MTHFFDFVKRSLYNISSLILFLSFAFFYLLKNLSNKDYSIDIYIELTPVILGSFLSLLCLIFYLLWRNKEYSLIKIHMKKNYLKFDFIAVIICFFLIPVLYIICIPFAKYDNVENESIILIALLVFYGFLILIAQTFHQYFLFKIKIELTKRRKGIEKDKITKRNSLTSKDKKRNIESFYEE